MKMKIFIKSLFVLLLLFCGCSKSVDETQDFKHLDDIRQARIGVILGSVQDAFVTKEMPEAEVVRVESETDLFLSLQQGKCNVAMVDFSIFSYARLRISGLEEIPSNFPPDNYGVAFHKEDKQLHAQFNAFLKEIKDSGLYQEIYDRWIVNGMKSKMPAIQELTEGEPLRVAVAGVQYPFSFFDKQEMVGFDIELSKRFAQKLQRPIEFQSISFGSLIASLQAGKSDMISSAMSITEERKKMVLFSDPYFQTYMVACKLSQGHAQNVSETAFLPMLKNSFYSNILAENRFMLILDGLKITVVISFFSLLLGTLLGGLICFMRMSKNLWFRNFATIYISVMRGTPVLVLLMLMFYVFLSKLPIDGVQVAVITFALNFAAYVSEMFRSAIQGVDRGQTEAGVALGFTPVQTFYHIVMPQAIKNVLPVYKGEMISLIKMTSIVGYIAVEDLTKMSDVIRSRTFDAFFPLIMVAILYFIIAWLFAKMLDMLNPKH